MYKEMIISIVIVAIILGGDIFTQKYTRKNVDELTNDITELISKLKEENGNIPELSQKIEEKVENIHKKLAYYIEHDELEKVETSYTVSKSLIESNEYEFAISELEKTRFILTHISDKYSFNLENIF